jgi:hypothetical protein
MGLFDFFRSSKIHELEELYVDKKNIDDFLLKYYLPRTPVLIKGGAAKWPLIKKWTKKYIVKSYGNYECTIVRDSRPAYSRETNTLKEYFRHYHGKSTLTLEKFINPKQLYFLKDIKIPNVFFSKNDIARYFFYHSVINAGTLPHIHKDAFNTLQQGKKHWIFYDAHQQYAPRGFQEMKKCHIQYAPGSHAKDWFTKELPKLPKRVEKVYQCFQEAGDIVYIPTQYSHAVINLSEVMGVVVETHRKT